MGAANRILLHCKYSYIYFFLEKRKTPARCVPLAGRPAKALLAVSGCPHLHCYCTPNNIGSVWLYGLS
ncbi:hypothetical protein GQ55_1G002000 [Panicum hallii var. hallii]|uniref:Uncharacterized protein n=1 Tax=Panicum hallii var. hallii TaxID=1504633 RepID=A0A2T7F0K8_9POAL|nr:hypothetical protein GQ55_1G002000 [Panicum hallii var. hallii]